MDSLYRMAVDVSMSVSGMTGPAATAINLFLRLQQQAAAVSGSMAGLNRSMAMLAGGLALTGAGLAGVRIMDTWVTKAGAMQDALVQVGIAAKGTQDQLRDLYGQSFQVASQTQFSAPQVLDMEQMMARMGFRDLTNKQTQRQVIGQAVPEFARAAEIDAHFQHVSYQSVVEALTQQAHMFGTYSGAALAKNVAYATGAGLSSGMTPQQQANTLRYLVPAQRTLGMTPLDAFSLAALGNQTGLTMGRGGSNIGALFRYMTPGGSAAHRRGMAEVQQLGGGMFFNQQGNFKGVENALRIVNQFMKDAPNGVTRMMALTDTFKVQGAQAASVLGSDAALKQFEAIRQNVGSYTPERLVGVQGQLNATLPGQMTTLQTNLQSIQALLGQQLLPAVVPVIHAFVELTGGILTFLRTHQGVAQFIATFTAVATAAALIAGPVLIAAGAFGILSAAGLTLDLAFLPFTAIVLGIVAAVAAVTLAVTHWGDIMAWVGQHATLLKNILVVLAVLFPPLVVAIGAAVLIFQHWSDIVHVVHDAMSVLGSFLQPFAGFLAPIIQAVGALARGFWTMANTTDLLKGFLSGLAAPFVTLGKEITTVHHALDALLSKISHGAVGAGVGSLAKSFLGSLIPSLPGGSILSGLGIGGGGSIYDRLPASSLPLAHPVASMPTPVMPIVPVVYTTPAHTVPVVHTTPIHAYHETVTHHHTSTHRQEAHQTDARTHQIVLNVHPNAVGPIHVHGAGHHDEESLAKRVGAHVVRDLGDELVHTLTSGAPSVFGLSPVLNTPAPR